MEHLPQILLLLGIGLAVVVVFQRLYIPSSLAYLLVGVIVGPYTQGPTIDLPELKVLAEFGVVFLLFTIGLSYSLPQLRALRHQVLGLGTAQVVLTTIIVAFILWLLGLSAAVSFVIGAVFAQSSSTIIASQLSEQGESNTAHGRLGLAISVFQDVTAVPFIVIIPVLGMSVGADVLGLALGWAFIKAVIAFLLVFFIGRWLLRPLFHAVSTRQSSEVFTLTVLLVALLAAWSSNSLGLSLAFGAFLAGMMLGETEFRHQVESSIRPFRDVLLGLFFIGIGMLFNPAALPEIWYLALLGGLLILTSKLLLVTFIVRRSGMDIVSAWRTGLLVSVGGEFGFALIAIALDSTVLSVEMSQIILTSVLFSLIGGSILIRFNHSIALFLSNNHKVKQKGIPDSLITAEKNHVIIGGYGRVGHTLAVLMQENGIPFITFDPDPKRVALGIADGFPIAYGDISDPELLDAAHVSKALLVVITIDQPEQALRAVSYIRKRSSRVPIIVRAQDPEASVELLHAGATHAYPEAIEASLSLGAMALNLLDVSADEIESVIQKVREKNYKPVLDVN